MSPCLLAGLAQAPIDPVRLVRGPTSAVPAGPDWSALLASPLTWGLGAAAVLLLLLAARFWYARSFEDPALLALRRISRRLRLSRDERSLVVRLAVALSRARHTTAAQATVPPVALLLSQEAFITAAELASRSAPTWAKPDVLRDLHRKIFDSCDSSASTRFTSSGRRP